MIAYQGCMSGRAFRVGSGFRAGFGLTFVKMFRANFGPAHKTFTTFRVTMFSFVTYDVSEK